MLTEFLIDKRNPATRKAYDRDLTNFFLLTTGEIPSRERVLEFLSKERPEAVALVLDYKDQLFSAGLSESTVNRRLAAIKSLCGMGRKLGICQFTLEDVQGERVQKYRDTTGITPEDYRRVLSLCDLTTDVGKRDYALLRLLWDNALRRNEVCQLNWGDFNPSTQELKIQGKGKGKQMEIIGISNSTCQAILTWGEAWGEQKAKTPIFVALDFKYKGHRLTGDGMYKLVRRYCQQAGIPKLMSPHRIRHSSITAALDATGGNVRKVQKLSRHRQLDTLMIYDDNRAKDQAEVSAILASLME